MDVEKLIEQAKKDAKSDYPIVSKWAAIVAKKQLREYATALSALQAENEKLRAELKSKVDLVFQQAKELDRRHLLLQEQEAEMEQVKRERDAAVSDLTFVVNQYRLETTGIDLCGLCEYDLPPVGENGQTAECPGFYVDDCFKWRGPEEG